MSYQYVTIDGKRVEKNVADSFNKLAAAFKRQFSLTLHVRSGTRTRAEQERLYKLYLSGRGNLAAKPGTSLHEESNPRGPRALDVHDSGRDWGVTKAGTVRANWLRKNAPSYGFDPAGYRFQRQIEPWHIEWTGTFPTSTPSSGSSSSNPFGIDDVRGLQKIAAAHGGNTKIDNSWGPQSRKGFAEFLRRSWGYSGNDVMGPNMREAMARWLRAQWGYSGNNVIGPNMRAALTRANKDAFDKRNDNGSLKSTPTPTPAPPPSGNNPFGISDVRGLQRIAQINGGKTSLDNNWGPESRRGFAIFLRKLYGYQGNDVLGPVMWTAIARWLRTRWGYVGNDIPGPVMRAALQRASNANIPK